MIGGHYIYDNLFTTALYTDAIIGPRFFGRFNSDEYVDIIGVQSDGVYLGVS